MKFNLEMNSGKSQGAAQPPEPSNEEENHEAEIVDVTDEDVERLNEQLDELNSALDILEQKNETIQAKIKEFLETNRELQNDVPNEFH